MIHADPTRIRELHRNAVVIDGHCDILIPVTDGETWSPFFEMKLRKAG